MKITEEVLQIIENKIWGDLESVNDYEKQLIKNKSTIKHNINHFSDSHKYIIYIDMLQNLKKLINDDETYIEYYGLEKIRTKKETEESKTKKAINAIKKEYELKLESLFTEDCTKNFGKGYGATIFASAHYFKAGIDTLSKLEKMLED